MIVLLRRLMLLSEHLIQKILAYSSQIGLKMHNNQIIQLDTYIYENLHWIEKHNVSGLRSVEEIVQQGIMDSIRLAPYLEGSSLLDIGSGAGLPGMILAILCPRLNVGLTEKRSKKIAFLKRACRSCGLMDRVCVIDARRGEPVSEYDCVTARAFSDLYSTLELCRTYLKDKGRVILPRSAQEAEQCLIMGANVFMYPHAGKKVSNRIVAIFN